MQEFPHSIVLKASAGSGKTHALTKRFVQFLLSTDIPYNTLRNVIAITFSNNAASEMRQRVVLWLKELALGVVDKLKELSSEINVDHHTLMERAEDMLDEIFDSFSFFQVKTIDSFMASIFKSSALDLGYNPDFDVLLDYEGLMEYAFEVFLRRVRYGSQEAELMQQVVELIQENNSGDRVYLWEPTYAILKELKVIHQKLASTGARLVIRDHSKEMYAIKDRLRQQVETLEEMIERSGLERSGTSGFSSILEKIRGSKFADLIKCGLVNRPVKKPSKKNPDREGLYEDICQSWEGLTQDIRGYVWLYSQTYYTPFMRVYRAFEAGLDKVKRQQNSIFIDDISLQLSRYIDQSVVPDVYFRLGQILYHYLIDEFQDTSPIQWKNLTPLVENSLSQGGSLFVVGDTKQAIYGFRNADYQIMKGLEYSAPFPCAKHYIRELDTNYRSLQAILNFNEAVFKRLLLEDADYKIAGDRSGLTDYTQFVKPGCKASGYAEVRIVELDEESQPDKAILQAHVQELVDRGYRYRDIAILTNTNTNVVQAAAWLNEKGIDFVSHSSLDIRSRKITSELVSLLNFLDSPLDDLSFAAFCLGDLFETVVVKDGIKLGRDVLQGFILENRENAPLYKAFQEQFPDIWKTYFMGLFKSAGYLPLYDLVTDIYRLFKVFETLRDEEASLVKLLEVIKNYEDIGNETIRDFLDYASDQDRNESEWTIDVPKSKDAVNIMTVHKAKGLGFPVVIALLYGQQNKGFDYLLDPADSGQGFEQSDYREVSILKVNKKMVSIVPEFLSAAYEAEATKDKVSRLNSLYVAFTRAMAELYVIGVKGGKASYPFNLLPVDEFQPSDKPDSILTQTHESDVLPFPLHYQHPPVTAGETSSGGLSMGRQTLNVPQRQRGELIHRCLSLIDYRKDVMGQLEEAIQRALNGVMPMNTQGGLKIEIMDVLSRFFLMADIKEYFIYNPGREFLKEQEFATADGRLFRMDLVVIDSDRAAVVDFKTSADGSATPQELNAQRLQMNNYVNILRGYLRTRRVEGIIANVDQLQVWMVA
ncbi:MAG: UvrD-helicase domain-containing protein [Nitrospirae bacterium]|nr:UvrD-helicase domain-containing protein [Nitrospirota bacterium]